MYTIEELIEIFVDQAKQSEKMKQDQLELWIKTNPGEDAPDYMLDDFNICWALQVMCQEIEKIKIAMQKRP